MIDVLSNYGLVAILASAMMTVAWLVHLKYKNGSLGDIPWCFGNIIFFALLTQVNHNWSPAHFVMLAMISFWSLRQGIYLTNRIFKDPYNEDGRFKKIRQDIKSHEGAWFFAMFQLQAVLQILLSSCYIVCARDSSLALGPLQILAVVLFVISFILQSIADNQLARFSSNPDNKNSVCKVGLWRFSRHPNYFFEWCIWLSFAIFASNSPLALLAYLSPLTIYIVLTQMSGVKLSEEVSLAKRGNAYREYMQETSSFLPMPPKLQKEKQ